MDSSTETIRQIEALGARNEARLALGEAVYAAASARRLVRYAASILPASGNDRMAGDIATARAHLTDALAALDQFDVPAKLTLLEAAE